ncbi:Hypothetical predicted protein [Mytilus galloprovincialis]|uniref:Novel STAND NTPase 3 domain-containing protein n=1 Tax=Mytilus galloprovincialis TaxID=29158 RepID=A0A8B6GSU1_MYTGA|nr:Hypothetical predicted protein [Mytilus galloprovincialis]
MEKLRAIRVGHRSAVTRLINRTKEKIADNDMENQELSATTETLVKKRNLLENLDTQILDGTKVGDMEPEVWDSDEFNLHMEVSIHKFKDITSNSGGSVLKPTVNDFLNQGPVAHISTLPTTSNVNHNTNQTQDAIQSTFNGGTNIYFLLSCSTMLGRSVRDLARPQNTAKGCNSWTRDLDNKDTPVFTDGLPDWTGFTTRLITHTNWTFTTHHATNSTPLVTYICTFNHHQMLFMPTLELCIGMIQLRIFQICVGDSGDTDLTDDVNSFAVEKTHHEEYIKEWEQDQTTFWETRATRHILEYLPSHNCIVVTGSSGCGKSSNIHHAALHLRDSFGYEIVPDLVGPTDIMNYYNKNKKQVFVVDDICGKETINTQTFQLWRDYLDKMEKIFKDVETDVGGKYDGKVFKVSSPKLLISCRLHIYKESQFQRLTLLTRNECNLLSPELCLLADERMHMLHMYLPDDIINNIKQVTENVDYFPLLCKLSKDKTSEEVKKMFTAPLISIKNNIINIINENKEQFCALVLCIVFNDGFNTDWLKLRSVSENNNTKTDTLEHIMKEFDIALSKEKQRNSLKASFTTLNGTYLKLRGTEYRIIHDKIYKMASVICGQHLTEFFIKYASSVFIRDNFIFESVREVHENDDLIVLSKDQEEDYFERLLCDLKEHVIISTFHNYQLIYQTFRDKLISFLKRKNDANTVLTKLDTEGCKTKDTLDPHYYTTLLIESTILGYFDIVHFLIVNVKCDVNKTDEEGNSPLHKASESGHTAVAKLLIENNADVSQCDNINKSPLLLACEGGHKDTVELLLQKKADVNQCDTFEWYPLAVACAGEHKDIVELLLQNKANVNQCDQYSQSSLCVACSRGNKDIVELLLQHKADVNQCNKNSKSPLYEACNAGHTDIVGLLLQNKADINQCDLYSQCPLCVACTKGYKDIVELLLQYKADVNQCNKNSTSPLYAACRRGRKDIVELLLQINADVNQYNMNGESPLYAACKGGHTDIVELLLQNNSDVNQCNKNNKSPLYAACKGGCKDIVELFLQINADVNQCYKNGKSPLYAACKGGRKDIVEILLQNNTVVNQCNKNGESPLCAACQGGHKDIVELLLQNNADVSHGDQLGQSPLYVACKGGHKDTVELLLQNNADVSHVDQLGKSPLYVACKGGHEDTVELLLQNKAEVNQCDEDDQSPLYAACQGGHINTVKMLLQNNADVSHVDQLGKSPLYVACKGGHEDTVELLLQNKAEVNQCDEDGQSPLYAACQGGHRDTVELLLQNNADANQCNKKTESPLYAACKGGHTYMVELLLQINADVNECNENGKSPLYAACQGGRKDTAELLLQNNADVNKCDVIGKSVLHAACKGGHTYTVELLLKNNADVNQCDQERCSPLFLACNGGHTGTVELLLQNNADVSKCNSDGQSPLFVACERGHTDTVELLLKNNADVSQCDVYGESSLFVACKEGFTYTVELLLQNNANVNQCNNNKLSPLHAASRERHPDIVKLLLQKKADINQRDTKGDSPLHAVCSYYTEIELLLHNFNIIWNSKNKLETVQILLAWNADAKMCNKYGQTPLDIASESHFVELINLFEENIKLKESQLNIS